VTADLFDDLQNVRSMMSLASAVTDQPLEIGGPWWFSHHFAERHDLGFVANIAAALAIRADAAKAVIPVRYTNRTDSAVEVTVVRDEDPPEGWTEEHPSTPIVVAPGEWVEIISTVHSPKSIGAAWRPSYIARAGGAVVGRAAISLRVVEWTIPQQ
jgi:hypothetical protein